eukprot:7283233-Ditylum_brightwellii.AAC.1
MRKSPTPTWTAAKKAQRMLSRVKTARSVADVSRGWAQHQKHGAFRTTMDDMRCQDTHFFFMGHHLLAFFFPGVG